ncbi:MAG: hypothetical protein ACREL7_02310 [Longimicrobiales bacterium]
MRYVLLCLPLVLAADFSEPALPACGEAALAAAPDQWDAENAVSGDLTQDGHEDVVFWKRDGDSVLLYIAACDGGRPVETWRFRVPLKEDCPPAATTVEVTNVLMDAALVERVCAAGNSDECQHMRRENQRRQTLTDGGARQLRVSGPACADTRLRWSTDKRGFMRIG